MCNLYSGILGKNYDVFDSPDSDSHEDIVKKYSLKDINIGKDREWVRFEILPLVSLDSINPAEWEYHLDEDGTNELPDWYNPTMAEKYCKEHLFKQLRAGRYKGVWLGEIRITKGTFTAPTLTKCGDVSVSGTFTAPNLIDRGFIIGGERWLTQKRR